MQNRSERIERQERSERVGRDVRNSIVALTAPSRKFSDLLESARTETRYADSLARVRLSVLRTSDGIPCLDQIDYSIFKARAIAAACGHAAFQRGMQ